MPLFSPKPEGPKLNSETGLPEETSDLLKASNSKQNASPFLNNDSTFTALFDDDEEDLALKKARGDEGATKLQQYGSASLERDLEESIRMLKKLYPMGGLKASRFFTAEILMKAPKNYLDSYEATVKDAVNWIQNSVAESGRSGEIGAAQEEPTNEEKGDTAYRLVQAAAAEYMDRFGAYRSLERAIIVNMICNEIIGFSVLDPLWRDPRVNEILCNGPDDIQVEISGKLYRVPACHFRDREHMMGLIERLYGAIGKQVAKTTPIVDGRLHDNSRMAVVHPSVAPDGPNFSIRRHKEAYIGPERMVQWGTASPELMTFLGNLLYKGCSILVLGGTSSGKTTLLGALSGFFRPDHRILTLEDNLELKLAPHKLAAAPMECVPGRRDSENNKGVDMRDLVKAALRLAPQAIVVGEVRDGAAYDLCQALNTGHYGMSTIHANSEFDGVYRLVSLVSQGGLMTGDATLPLIAASFDVIVRIERFPTDGSRKIVSVSEVSPFPEKKESGELHLPLRPLWRFVDEGLDGMKVLGHWEQQNDIGEDRRLLRRLDLEKDLSWEELVALSKEAGN